MPTLTVLVADRDATIRDQVAEPLVALGYETVRIADGGAALRVARSGVDVAIVEARLAGIEGLDVVRILRGEGKRLPIVMMGDAVDEVERIVAYEGGVDDYGCFTFSARRL